MAHHRTGAAAALEDVLEKGALRMSDADAARVEADLERAGAVALCGLLEKIRSGDASPESLLDAFASERQREIAGLAPPRLEPGAHGKSQELRLEALNRAAGAEPGEPSPTRDGRPPIARIAALPAHTADEAIATISDVSLLWCLAQSGRIAERRAAVRRIGRLVAEGAVEWDGIDERDLLAGLAALRDPRIAFEVDTALAAAPGSPGRAARQRLARVDRLLSRVQADARRFWTGDAVVDPIDTLSREESLRLGLWLRRAPDSLAAHVAEHIRLLLGRDDPRLPGDAVGAVIPSGDERLVPIFCRILADGPLPARIAAARALGRIADPRVHPALAKAYRHVTDATEKVVLGGSLGQFGDGRALDFLLERLDDPDPSGLEETVRSLGSIGAPEAAARLVPLLESERPTIVRTAARALVRCGGLEELKVLRRETSSRSIHSSALSDAAEALALRLQLSGALPADSERRLLPKSRLAQEQALAAADHADPPFVRRLEAVWHHVLGLIWSALWQRARALTAFAAAAKLHPGAASPRLHEAALHAANGRDDLAIDAFRGALAANRASVLRRPAWVRRLLRTYLQRVDDLVARRRKREALVLLDEIATLDLRAADLDLRLAMTRRRDKLLVDRARRRQGAR
jgi:HEAT repeat protein